MRRFFSIELPSSGFCGLNVLSGFNSCIEVVQCSVLSAFCLYSEGCK